MVILAEAQSTWTMNIIIRALMYMVQTYHDYFDRTKQNLYKSKKVKLPIPEIYVIYTGDRKTRPSEVSLAKEFFEGEQSCIDVKVKMIYDGEEGDIIKSVCHVYKSMQRADGASRENTGGCLGSDSYL